MTRRRVRLQMEPAWTLGANPHVAAFARSGGAGRKGGARAPFAHDVRGSKGSPAYRAHMYHTKVPPEAIEP